MADQDQTIEKKSEGIESENIGKISDFGAEKMEEGELLDAEKKLDDLSSPENSQEKEKEILEIIKQKSGSSNDYDNDSDDNDHKKIKDYAKSIAETGNVDQQIDKLVSLAIQKDPYTAMKVAKHLDENYILDQVHDRLVEEETKKALIDKGLLKEI